jgi:hypothetical protein
MFHSGKDRFVILVIILLLNVLASCEIESDNKNDTEKESESKSTIQVSKELVSFTSKDSLDTFLFTLYESDDSLLIVVFNIINHNGKSIYRDSLNDEQLFDYEDLDQYATLSYSKKKERLRSKLNEYFEDESFHYPAISDEDLYDPDYTDLDSLMWRKIWAEESIGFSYYTGEGNIIWITFSSELDQVIVYQYCC